MFSGEGGEHTLEGPEERQCDQPDISVTELEEVSVHEREKHQTTGPDVQILVNPLPYAQQSRGTRPCHRRHDIRHKISCGRQRRTSLRSERNSRATGKHDIGTQLFTDANVTFNDALERNGRAACVEAFGANSDDVPMLLRICEAKLEEVSGPGDNV